MILKRLTVGPLQVNCYILVDEKTKIGCVIDAGGNGEKILQTVKALGVEKLKYVFFTHGHFDHIGAVSFLKENCPDTKILIGEKDSEMLLSSSANLSASFGAPQSFCSADGFLYEGDKLQIGEITLKVHLTPGHTKGGLIFICEEEKIVFSGDTLFAGSIGRTDFPGGSFAELSESLEFFKKLSPEYKVYTGHGYPTTIENELKTNIYLR